MTQMKGGLNSHSCAGLPFPKDFGHFSIMAYNEKGHKVLNGWGGEGVGLSVYLNVLENQTFCSQLQLQDSPYIQRR